MTIVSSVTNLVGATGTIQAQTAGGSGINFTWVILLVLVLFWVFMIVQSRRRKQQQLQQRAGMEPGTRVMLTSGIIGTLVERTPDTMVVEVADGVQLTVVPGAIARPLPTLDPTVDADADDVGADTETGYTNSSYTSSSDTEPTYTDTTAAGESQYANDDRIVDVDPGETPARDRRDSGTGESAVHEGR